jgi:hypothetical protein
MSHKKRRGSREVDLPIESKVIEENASKADLLEIAWELVAGTSPVSWDDHAHTTKKMVDLLNERRTDSGRRLIKLERRQDDELD